MRCRRQLLTFLSMAAMQAAVSGMFAAITVAMAVSVRGPSSELPPSSKHPPLGVSCAVRQIE